MSNTTCLFRWQSIYCGTEELTRRRNKWPEETFVHAQPTGSSWSTEFEIQFLSLARKGPSSTTLRETRWTFHFLFRPQKWRQKIKSLHGELDYPGQCLHTLPITYIIATPITTYEPPSRQYLVKQLPILTETLLTKNTIQYLGMDLTTSGFSSPIFLVLKKTVLNCALSSTWNCSTS